MKEYGKAIVLLMIILLIWASCQRGADDARVDSERAGFVGGVAGQGDADESGGAAGQGDAGEPGGVAGQGDADESGGVFGLGEVSGPGEGSKIDCAGAEWVEELVDFTGDGLDEKVCIRWAESGAGGSGYDLAVYEQTDGSWREIGLPGVDVRVTLERLGDTRLRVKTPRFEAGVELDVEKSFADQIWSGTAAGAESVERALLMGQSRLLIDTRTGEPVILLDWNLGVSGQLRADVATGILAYAEGEWVIRDVELGENVVWSGVAGEYLQKVK